MKKYLTLLLSGISLIGCASSDDLSLKQNTLPLQAEVCCESSSSYPWIRLHQDQDLKFKLNASSPVGYFNGQKSYFSAFTFAQQSGSVELRLRSLMLDGEVAVPQIELLDENFNVVKAITSEEFQIKFSDALAKSRYELLTSIDTVKTPYMIVHVDSEKLGSKVVVPHPAKIRAQESGEPMPIVTDPTYLASNLGQFSLSVETTTLSGYNQKSLVEAQQEKQIAPKVKTKTVNAIPETQTYYHNAIRKAVESDNLDKALSLLDEAKALNVEGAQEVFIKAVNSK